MLNPRFPTLPTTSKTLKSNFPKIVAPVPRAFPMACGEYVHFDWVPGLKSIIERDYSEGCVKHVSLSVNIDGIPFFQ